MEWSAGSSDRQTGGPFAYPTRHSSASIRSPFLHSFLLQTLQKSRSEAKDADTHHFLRFVVVPGEDPLTEV